MEHTYRVTDRASLFIIGIVFTLVGGLFAVIGLLVALVDRDSSGSSAGRFFGGLVFAGAGSLVAYVGWDHLFRRPWRIRVWPDGEIEIRHAFSRSRGCRSGRSQPWRR